MAAGRDDTIYVISVHRPGTLPEMEPYATRGAESAYACAKSELEDGDSLGYSRAEWDSALQAGGASVPLRSGYTIEVTPLDSLGLDPEDRDQYIAEVEEGER